MKITNRKDEVRISRLLGASKFYVKKPFLIEGVFYGFVGSILGCTVSLFLALYFKDKINTFFQPVTFVGSDAIFYLKLLFSCLGSGITFGYIASWLGVKRYIKF
jgi:cell division transport system permease protein